MNPEQVIEKLQEMLSLRIGEKIHIKDDDINTVDSLHEDMKMAALAQKRADASAYNTHTAFWNYIKEVYGAEEYGIKYNPKDKVITFYDHELFAERLGYKGRMDLEKMIKEIIGKDDS